jgi:hypothetical protein
MNLRRIVMEALLGFQVGLRRILSLANAVTKIIGVIMR